MGNIPGVANLSDGKYNGWQKERMNMIHSIVQKQRDYFHTGATLPLAFRKAQLKKLQAKYG